MVITGARGTYAQFGSQIASEFQGQNNFTYWLIAIGSIGALGYIQTLQTISRYLMALILLSIFLSHKGFFAQFQSALKTGAKTPNAATSLSSITSGQASPTSQSSTADLNSAITSNQTGPFGSTPNSAGQAKAFGWLNYFFGLGTNSAGAPQ